MLAMAKNTPLPTSLPSRAVNLRASCYRCRNGSMRWSRRSTRPARIRESRRRPMAWSRRRVRCANHRASRPAARPVTRARRSNALPIRPTRSITRCRSSTCVATARCRWSRPRWPRGARSSTCQPRCLASSSTALWR